MHQLLKLLIKECILKSLQLSCGSCCNYEPYNWSKPPGKNGKGKIQNLSIGNPKRNSTSYILHIWQHIIFHSVPLIEVDIMWFFLSGNWLTREAYVLLALSGSYISKAALWPEGCCCRRSRTSAHRTQNTRFKTHSKSRRSQPLLHHFIFSYQTLRCLHVLKVLLWLFAPLMMFHRAATTFYFFTLAVSPKKKN